jgi:drug/metabolite transporter (DMT)-like permease
MKEPLPTALAANDRVGFGIGSVVGAVICFSIVDATAKWLGQTYEPIQIVFLRYLFGLIPIVPLIWRAGGFSVLRTRRPLAHVLRASLLFGAFLAFISALRALPLAEAVAIGFTAPLFVTALARPMLGEAVGPRRWAAVVVGFMGALVMLRPGSAAFRPEALLVLASALSFAVAMLLTRRLARTETNVAMLAYTTFGACLASLPFLSLVWRAPTDDHFGLFVLLGIFGGTAAYLLIVAYRHAPAAVIAPFDYTGLIWASLLGWILWRESPEPAVWIGAAVIALSGIYITHRETVRRRQAP